MHYISLFKIILLFIRFSLHSIDKILHKYYHKYNECEIYFTNIELKEIESNELLKEE